MSQTSAEKSAIEQVIQAAARVIATAALGLLQVDPHNWSGRPCGTCEAVSRILDVKFGCVLYREQQEEAVRRKVSHGGVGGTL